jgi:hypothetical protein
MYLERADPAQRRKCVDDEFVLPSRDSQMSHLRALVLTITALAALFTGALGSECRRLFQLEEIGMSAASTSSPWQLSFVDFYVDGDEKMLASCNCSLELSALVRLLRANFPVC